MKKILKKSVLSVRQLIILSCVCLVLVFCINSCKKDQKIITTTEQNSNQPLEKKITLPNVQGIGFSAFLDSLKKLNSNALTNTFTTLRQQSGQLKINDAGSSNSISLFIDSIKFIQKAGHQTYTIPLKQVNANDVTFRNLIIDTYNGNVNTFLATYTPDTAYLKSFIKGLKVPYTGKGKLTPFSLTTDNNLQVQNNGLKANYLACYTIDVLLYTFNIPCSTGRHYYGDPACEWTEESDGTPAYLLEVWGSEDICYDSNIVPTGGGGGGGGGTSPAPPPGYDPCPPVAVESSGLRVQHAEGEPPCVPPPPQQSPAIFHDPAINVDATKTPPCIDSILKSIKTFANTNEILAEMALFNSGLQAGQTNPFSDVSGMINRMAFSTTWNVSITTANIPPDFDPNTNITSYPNAQTGTTAGAVKITLDSSYIKKASDLSIARTIIHELLHAYFDYAISNTTDPEHANFVEINNLLFNKKGNPSNDYNYDPNATQHEQMAARYVTQIGLLLRQFAIANQIQSPDPAVSLEQYCLDLAWGGLSDTKAYRKYAPNKNRIQNELINELSHNNKSSRKKSC